MRAQGNPNLAEFVLIEYPGVIHNLGRALETLGGSTSISKAHFASNQMELQLRPDNPFHSSLVAERRNQSVIFSGQLNLVLRCRKRKINPTGEQQRSGTREDANENDLEITCLGMVSTIYSFKTICDFQFLPLSNSSREHQGVSVHHDLMPHIMPSDFAAALNWWDEQRHNLRRITGGKDANSTIPLETEVENFLPPYQFSRYNNPSKFLLHDEIDHRVTVQSKTIGPGKSLRGFRKALTVTVNNSEPFPIAPSEEALSDVGLRCKNAEHHRMLIELFAERPLWSRIAICYRTQINESLLKIILAKYAFYVVNGPWGRLWCRFGYDPRKDPEARKYQSLMVSFKRNQHIPERQRLRANTTTAGSTYNQFCDYVYRPKTLPDLRQMWYCICDVQLQVAQKICLRDYPERMRECDPINGWLPHGRIQAIRRAIKEDVILTSQRLGDMMGRDEEMVDDDEDDDFIDDDDEEERNNQYMIGDEDEDLDIGRGIFGRQRF